MRYVLLLGFIALPLLAQSKRVFIITDAEGVAGVCRQEQTDPKDAELRQLLTGEINAAVQGFFDGGASEVFVWDGHDGSETLSALTIDPRAKLVMGRLESTILMERRFAAVAFVGQHARANSRGGVMAHSYSSLGIQNLLMNGKPVGEVETRTALAGWFGTPVIFLSGDQMAAEQLHAIVPEAETAVVKEGLDNYACISLSAEAARKLIREGAKNSMGKLGHIQPYKLNGPVTFQIEYTSRHALRQDAGSGPGEEVVDARTIRFHGKDFIEAWKRTHF
ncbi:MAG TPA: M55 family metallopeptidase [Bryobacteraceae bacterium]|nr:M55 family metallopeptidase [Bryobacteraceae bacterium]